jgi:hypothetical protein
MSGIVYALIKYASATDGINEKNELISVHESRARAFESAQLQTQTILAELILFLESEQEENEFQLLVGVKKQYKKLSASTNIEEINNILVDTLDEIRLFPEVYELVVDKFTVYFHSVDDIYCENITFNFRIFEKVMETNEEIDVNLLSQVNQYVEDK